MADNTINSIIRVKQADGTYITVLPQTKSTNNTNVNGRTLVEILSEDVAYNSNLSAVAKSGNYEDLTNKPDIKIVMSNEEPENLDGLLMWLDITNTKDDNSNEN